MKHDRLSWFSSALIASAFAAGGCGQAGQPSEEDYDDVAQGVSMLVSDGENGGDVGSMNDSIALAGDEMPEGFTRQGTKSVQGMRGALQYDYTITCRDSADAELSDCGPSTDSAHVQVAWTGDVQTARYDVSVARTGDWTLSDLQSGMARFSGEGTFDLESEFMALYRPAMRTYLLDYDAFYQDILIDMATGEPHSGTASFDVAAQRTGSNQYRDVEAEFDVHVDVTFNGDGTASVVLDGTRNYELTLADGTIIQN